MTVGIGLVLLIVVCAVGKPGDMMSVNTKFVDFFDDVFFINIITNFFN